MCLWNMHNWFAASFSSYTCQGPTGSLGSLHLDKLETAEGFFKIPPYSYSLRKMQIFLRDQIVWIFLPFLLIPFHNVRSQLCGHGGVFVCLCGF